MQANTQSVDLLLIEGYRLTTAGTEGRAPGQMPEFLRVSKVSDGKSPARTEYIRKSRSQTGPNKGERFADNRALNTQLVVTQDPRRPRPSYPYKVRQFVGILEIGVDAPVQGAVAARGRLKEERHASPSRTG